MFRARYVRRCEVCQKGKSEQQRPAGQIRTRQIAEPMVVLCVDFMGPLPRSKCRHTMLLAFHDGKSHLEDESYRNDYDGAIYPRTLKFMGRTVA